MVTAVKVYYSDLPVYYIWAGTLKQYVPTKCLKIYIYQPPNDNL